MLGNVGPFGDFLEPVGDTTADELREAFQAQIAARSRPPDGLSAV
jgi:hypothetical protein